MSALLSGLDSRELAGLARVAERLLAAQPRRYFGHHVHRRRSGSGNEFHDFRVYTPGDDLRSVDWRASLRSRQVQVRRHRDETTSDWLLCLDRSASMSLPDPAKWRQASLLALALAYVLLHLGHRVGLALYSAGVDQALPVGLGAGHFARIAATIGAARPRPSGGASRPGKALGLFGGRPGVVVISDFLAPDALRGDLARLQRHSGSVHALQVISANETRLTPAGAVRVRDVETGEEITLADPAVAGESAARALRQLGDDLHAFCARQGIVYTRCAAEESWRDAVLAHLHALAGGRAGLART